MKSPECIAEYHIECDGVVLGSNQSCDCHCHGGGGGVREPLRPLETPPGLKVLIGV